MLQNAAKAIKMLGESKSEDELLACLVELEATAYAGRCGGIPREDVITAAMLKKKTAPDSWTKEVSLAYGRVMSKSMRAAPVKLKVSGEEPNPLTRLRSRSSTDCH